MMNTGYKKIKTIVFLILLVPIAYFMCHFADIKREYLKMTIAHNLKTRYGETFECVSVSINGDAIKYVCYPQTDQSLHFDGLVGSYDTYPGAIISKDDSLLLENYMNSEPGNVFVYCMPVTKNDPELTHMIKVGRCTADELRTVNRNSRRYFYIFFNVSSDPDRSFEDEYDMIRESTGDFITYYKLNYDMDIVADVNIHFVNQEEYEFSKTFFQTHVESNFDLNREICSLPIIMRIGNDDGISEDNWIITRDEYVAERREILERYGR